MQECVLCKFTWHTFPVCLTISALKNVLDVHKYSNSPTGLHRLYCIWHAVGHRNEILVIGQLIGNTSSQVDKELNATLCLFYYLQVTYKTSSFDECNCKFDLIYCKIWSKRLYKFQTSTLSLLSIESIVCNRCEPLTSHVRDDNPSLRHLWRFQWPLFLVQLLSALVCT